MVLGVVAENMNFHHGNNDDNNNSFNVDGMNNNDDDRNNKVSISEVDVQPWMADELIGILLFLLQFINNFMRYVAPHLYYLGRNVWVSKVEILLK